MNHTVENQIDKNETKKESRTSTLTPLVNILEGNDSTLLILEMPGVEESTVDISIEKDVLQIKGKPTLVIPTGYKQLHLEFLQGEYLRKFTINRPIDFDRIEAKIKNGRLTISLPKVQPNLKKIEINTN
jgi:HSP20 family protein